MKSKFTEAEDDLRHQAVRTRRVGGRGVLQNGNFKGHLYNWKKKYGGLGMANLNPDKQMLQDVLRKKP